MSRREKHQVLIAEDSHVASRVIARLVQEMGSSVVGRAVDGLDAVTKARSLRPDVIVMDIEMPEMNGIEAARQIQETCPTPVVILTAYETPRLVGQAIQAGVGAYLVKPPRSRELEHAIAIAIARFDDLIKQRQLNAELQACNAELEEALARVRTLRGLLPICANCKRIRDDQGYWHEVEVYIRDHSDARFSHGLCPGCASEPCPDSCQEEGTDDRGTRDQSAVD